MPSIRRYWTASGAFMLDMPSFSSEPQSQMDAASVMLSEGLDPTMPQTYTALSDFSNAPASTL